MVIELWTGIPASRVQRRRIRTSCRRLEDGCIHSVSVGQDEAVDRRGGRHPPQPGRQISPKRPSGVLHLCRAPPAWARPSWSRCWQQDAVRHARDALIRLDMSEFMEKHSGIQD